MPVHDLFAFALVMCASPTVAHDVFLARRPDNSSSPIGIENSIFTRRTQGDAEENSKKETENNNQGRETRSLTPVLPTQECTFSGWQICENVQCAFPTRIKTFDSKYVDYYPTGEYWIVKSDTILIKGSFAPAHAANGGNLVKEISIGGPLLKDNRMVIGMQLITWDDTPLQQGVTWQHVNPPISVVYKDQHDAGQPFHVVHINLPGVVLRVDRSYKPQASYMNISLTMPAQPGQNGLCGNFNGDPTDDA